MNMLDARMLRQTAKKIPVVASLYRAWSNARFRSASYWESRYKEGGTSGDGSYGELAAFKAEVINRFISEHAIASVVDFGCGDGNQLALARYPKYTGLDVAPKAISLCLSRFGHDPHKSFFLYDPQRFHDRGGVFDADCALSLDVIYHLVEDSIYAKYLEDVFRTARKYAIIYSSDQLDNDFVGDRLFRQTSHIRHRHVTEDVKNWFPEFSLVEHIPNRYPERTFASFYIFKRD